MQRYPWVCLCLGFSQITMTLPRRLMILHFSQMGFTELLTFIPLFSFQILMPFILYPAT
jgi:hypothetical protein